MPQRKMQAGHSSLPLRKLESDAEDRRHYGHCRRYYSPLPQRRIESDAEGRCGDGRSRRAILHRHDDCAASIPKFGPEIKNRCTKEGVNGEKLTSIRKSGLEIKNQCTLEGVNRQNLASIRKSGLKIKNRCMQQAIFSTRSLDESLWRYVGGKLEVIVWTLIRQWRQMRVLMRPEAAFPYVFAAEGAQHPPIGRHALRSPPNNSRSTIATQRSPLNEPAATKKRLYIKKKSGPVFD